MIQLQELAKLEEKRRYHLSILLKVERDLEGLLHRRNAHMATVGGLDEEIDEMRKRIWTGEFPTPDRELAANGQ